MLRNLVGVSLLLLVGFGPTAAQDHANRSEHAGKEARAIKAMAGEEVRALLAGEGAGYALAAELNGYPGPRHVLHLRQALGLTADQVERVDRIFRRMSVRARELGARLVERERELDRLFRERTVTESELERLLEVIGLLEAELRRVHLDAHLTTTSLLDEGQIRRYEEARGYGHGARGGS